MSPPRRSIRVVDAEKEKVKRAQKAKELAEAARAQKALKALQARLAEEERAARAAKLAKDAKEFAKAVKAGKTVTHRGPGKQTARMSMGGKDPGKRFRRRSDPIYRQMKEDTVLRPWVFVAARRTPTKHVDPRTESEEKLIGRVNELEKQRKNFYSSVGPRLKCALCQNYLYKPVLIHTCGHRFCGACLSADLRKPLPKVENAEHECPECELNYTHVTKDKTFAQIVDSLGRYHPELMEFTEEYKALKNAHDRFSHMDCRVVIVPHVRDGRLIDMRPFC